MTAHSHRRVRGLAAVSLAATAGLLGTYLGQSRTAPRAYAQPGAPFQEFFSASDAGIVARADGPLREALDRDGALLGGGSIGLVAPVSLADCTVQVFTAVGLQQAVDAASDGDQICITDDILDLDAPIRVTDTSLTIVGAAGPAGEDPISLVAGDNRHVDALFTGGGYLTLANMALTGGDAGNGVGGSIRFRGPGAGPPNTTLALGYISFTDNSAFRGGAIHIQDAGQFYMTQALLEGNTATNAGGAIYARNVTAVVAGFSAMVDNDGGTAGGAIAAEADATDMQVYLAAVTLSGNTASAIGGAVAITGEERNVVFAGAGIPVSPLTFTGNTAGSGGAVWLSETGAGQAGAIIEGEVTFSRNRATSGNGGAMNLSTDGGAAIPTLLTLGNADNGHATFARNRAAGDGGAAWIQGALLAGGLGYVVDPQTDLTTVGGVFARNRAVNGGAVKVEGVATTLRTVFNRNVATANGGALDIGDSYLGYLTYSSFGRNAARGGDGGATFTGSGSVGGTVALSSTFIGNTASGEGGAIAALSGEVAAVNATLTKNRSGGLGGGVYSAPYVPAEFVYSTVTANRAGTGGGIAAQAPEIVNSIVQRNRATGGLGGADVAADNVVDSYSLFTSESSVTASLTPGGWTPGPSSYVTSWPVVAAPADNGGPAFPGSLRMLTMAPLNGSPVIEAGAPGVLPLVNDQRGVGYPRIEGPKPDMGAIEWRIQEESLGLSGARGTGNKANRVTLEGRISGVYVGTVALTVRIGREPAQIVTVRVRDGGAFRWSRKTTERVTAVARAAGFTSPRVRVPGQR